MANSLTKEQFIAKATSIHGNRFSYEKTIYVNMRKPITIICKIHGEFKQSPMNHLKTDGCPKCGYENRHKPEPEQPKVEEEKKVLTDEELMERILKTYSDHIKTTQASVDPFSKTIYETNKRPIAKCKIQSSIVLSDEMLEIAANTGVIAYETMNEHHLSELSIEKAYTIERGDVELIKKVIPVDWDSIALNISLNFEQLMKYKDKISLDYLVHSPAFIGYAVRNVISMKSNILTYDQIQEISKKYKDNLLAYKLGDDWFDDNEIAENLYSSYVIPKLVNGGIKLTPKLLSKFKARIITFTIDTIINNTDIKLFYRSSSIINSLPEDMFMVVYDGISFSMFKKQFLHIYMHRHYINDDSLEKLIKYSNSTNVINLISETQVPSIKFMKKYKELLDPILVIRNMIKNGRIYTSFIEEFIDELITYNKKRSEIFKENTAIKFTGGNEIPSAYIMGQDQDIYSTDNMMPPPIFSNSIHYNDRNGFTSQSFEYYREDILKNLYSKCNSKLFKKLYESIRFDNDKNNEMVASIQTELETLLNNSKMLQEKLTKFKKSI